MKDEHDKRTLELVSTVQAAAEAAPPGQTRPPAGGTAEGRKPKRLPRQSIFRPPEGAKPEHGAFLGFGRSVVPVSSVARDMGISARRVRVMLTEGRLMGRRLENGYWEVYYPYQYILGTRGPALKRQRNLPEPAPRKRERNSGWW